MRFTKPALSLNDQIALLERRNMAVPDHARAAHYLRHISYYRLRAYWLPYEMPAAAEGGHAFTPGTAFDDALSLYIFDRRLRLHVLDAIERIEVSLRAAWAHHLAMTYGPHGYLDPSLYDREHYNKAIIALRQEIERSRDTFMIHYRQKYDEPELPPVWMTAEIISLGQLSKWLGNLKHRADRRAIARPYGLDERVLRSFAHHMTHVRNICAHHGRLWNRQFTVTATLPRYPADLAQVLNTSEATSRRLYNTLAMIVWLLRIIAPGSAWKEGLLDLLAACPQANLAAMGFPRNWRAMQAWGAT